MPLDLATAQTHLEQWLAADTAVSKNQSYSIGGRSLSRADVREIRESINYWQGIVNSLNGQVDGSRTGGFGFAQADFSQTE